MRRLVTVPYHVVTFPVRVAAVSARVGWRTGRVVGPNRAAFFGAGVATGVLLASPRARRLAVSGVAAAARAVADARRRREPPPGLVTGAPVSPSAPVPAVPAPAAEETGAAEEVQRPGTTVEDG